MLNKKNWTSEIERVMDSAENRAPADLLKDLYDIGSAMGEDSADALLDDNQDLFKFAPILTEAYQRTVVSKEIAEIERISQMNLDGPVPFTDVAGPPTIVTYNRVGEMFAAIDFSNCHRLVMVGCGRLPAAVFHVHDRTDVPEIVCLDVLPEAVSTAGDLLDRLGYSRARTELCDGRRYDYADTQIVLIANMVSPKSEVVSRIADTAAGDVRIVVRDSLSLGRLWSDNVERSLDPRLEVMGRSDGRKHWSLSRDLYLKLRAPIASKDQS